MHFVLPVHEKIALYKKRSRSDDQLPLSYWVRESNPYCKIENLEY